MRKVFTRSGLFTRDGGHVLPEFEQFPEGIQLLHQPSKPAVVDIVFIHGLTGDRQRTWTHPEDRSPWPKTLLPQLIPNARILTYGYDAYVIRQHGPVSSNRVRDHANHLLSHLATHRLDASARPIIFIAHSLGGLVCKDALLLSRSSPEAHIQSIVRSTFAMTFMGTPHSGSALAAWAQIPAKSLGIVKSSNANLLAVLQTSSEVLSRIQDDFLSMLRALVKEESHIQITCFHETLPLPVLGIIVPRDSAVLSGYQSIPIRANHSNMVKFKSANDPGFVGVSGELIRWVKEIQNSTTFAGAKTRFLQSLAFPEMGARLINVESPFDNTCE
jgi:pimeloyl-ACP methyl ester carboxylesterase